MDVLASGSHRDVEVLLSMASDDMGWWVANDFDRFDPHTLDRITDEVAGWRISRSRAKKIVDAYDRGGRTPAEVRAALMTDYIFALPAARGALAQKKPPSGVDARSGWHGTPKMSEYFGLMAYTPPAKPSRRQY